MTGTLDRIEANAQACLDVGETSIVVFAADVLALVEVAKAADELALRTWKPMDGTYAPLIALRAALARLEDNQ